MSAEPIQLRNSTPFDLIAEAADDLLTEAHVWADGTPVETQGQADDVSRLMDELAKVAKAADDARKEENRPHDDAKAAVQAKYAPLFADPKTKAPGKVHRARDALKAVLTPYLAAQEAKKREVERLAREAAEAAERAAQEAMRQAAASDLAAREAAETKVQQAADAQKAARRAADDKAHATGGSRAIGLRTAWTATLTDPRAAAAHYWSRDPAAFNAVLQKLADDDVRSGKRIIPGFDVTEGRVL